MTFTQDEKINFLERLGFRVVEKTYVVDDGWREEQEYNYLAVYKDGEEITNGMTESVRFDYIFDREFRKRILNLLLNV